MGEPFIEGCMDLSACNYDANATIDDNGCVYAQENYDCNGICIAINPNDCCENSLIPDCNGICGGAASVDCAGICNGNSTNDKCGVCGGDGSTCNISYSLTIQPIFENKCTPCHISNNSGGLNLSSWENLNNSNVIIPSQSNNSLLVTTLESGTMPITGCCLEPSLIQLIATWIDEGALNN